MPRLHPFQKRTLDFIQREHLLAGKDHVLVAVSGGPDSVALLDVLTTVQHELQLEQVSVLHFDHQLRGRESAEDRLFVEALARRLHVPLHCATEDVRSYGHRNRISLEMAARACRHRFFQDTLAALEGQKIALGHTANDQAEEVLLRLLRGTGPSGLAGMLPKTDEKIIRPLLHATRPEILDYLGDRGLTFREDSSNRELFCQRNVLRHRVFPVLQELFHENVVETLSRHARLVRDEEDHWAQKIHDQWRSLCLVENPSQVVLKVLEILPLHPALQRRILRFAIERLQGNLLGIYTVHLENLCGWLPSSASGKVIHLPGGLRAAREGDTLVLSKRDPSSSQARINLQPFSIPGPGQYVWEGLGLHLSLKDRPRGSDDTSPPASPGTAWLDGHKILWPLVLRSWKPGDRFQPLGLRGSKKLHDFFIDSKIPKASRDRIPILCDREKICWVVGLRLDDRVKVTSETRRVLIVEVR